MFIEFWERDWIGEIFIPKRHKHNGALVKPFLQVPFCVIDAISSEPYTMLYKR